MNAKIIVDNKINNQYRYLAKFHANHPSTQIEKILKLLNETRIRIVEVNKIDQVMGIEGKSSNMYFSCFNELIRKTFIFSGRNRQPPKDPVNSLLSLSYSMLTNEIFSMLYGSGFDAYIGFLHELSYNRPSLALDLVEEFRVTMDQFVCKLVNLEIVKQEDFFEENGGVFLTDEARKTSFKQYEKYIQENQLRKIIKIQIYAMMKTIQIKAKYTPYQGFENCIT